jgi:3-oxoacyl-[acyl-carrier protein] reductase
MRKFALVTGASGGIGQAIALRLAQDGYSLYLHYHQNEKAIDQLIYKLQQTSEGDYIPVQADLSSPTGYKTLAQNIFSIDCIIHNSGNSHYGLLTDLTDEQLQIMMAVHVNSPIMLTRELLPKLISQKSGNIIVISSIWGQTGAACEVAYSAAKGAQLAFVKALSKEVGLNGIRVNAIAPGIIDTPMIDEFSSEDLDTITSEIPMGKIGKPQHIADSVSFLLSEQSSYITGQTIAINGGWYM